MDTVTILGAIAGTIGTLLGFGMFSQIAKIHQRKAADEISYITFSLFFLNTLGWLAYGIASKDWPIVAANVVAMIGSAGILMTAYYYNRKNKQPSDAQS